MIPKRALRLVVLLLAACSPDAPAQDDSVTPIVDAPPTTSVDGGPVLDAPAVVGACNPLSPAGMQGCAAGQKCTWISLVTGVDPADDLGKTGCVPEGPVALGEACTSGEPGEATGFDNCAAGGYCISGSCQDICGFDDAPGATCTSGFACTRYAGLFANGDDAPAFGACNPTCDPLAQTCGANRGCYLLSSDTGTSAVCAAAGSAANVHNVQIRAAGATTPVYVNTCAPGFMPRAATQGEGAAIECGGLCKPADVYADTPASGATPAQAGLNDGRQGRPDYEGGNPSVMNWLGLPATCANAAGGEGSLGGQAVLPSNQATGESCQYYYMSELYSGVSAYSNTVGMCFQYRQWRFDGTPPTDGSTPTPDTAWPSCRDLNRAAPTLPAAVVDGAAYFGCTALMPALVAAKAVRRRPTQIDRMAPLRR